MKDYRYNFIFIFIGFNRTGKTSDAIKYAHYWKDANNGSIIAYDPQNKFRGLATDFIIDVEDIDDYINSKRTLFIFDDYRALFTSDKMNKTLSKMMTLREENCNDFIFITHSPALILERLSYFVTDYFIYFTMSTDKGFNDKLLNSTTLIKCRDIINDYTKKYGRGEYPVFPCIRFNNATHEVTFINMPNLKIK